MFPVELDHHILSNMPLPTEHGIKKVFSTLNSLVTQRIVPYFRSRRGTDLMQLAQVKQNFTLQRLDDERSQIRILSLITQTGKSWNIQVHERFFDYLAFVIPLKPEFSLADASADERKMVAFCEFFLRHSIEHMLYPEKGEHDVIRSDIDFGMRWRSDDPTSYRMLRNALTDKMNGIHGKHYLELLDLAEQGKFDDRIVGRMVDTYVALLSGIPASLLEALYPSLDSEVKILILGECNRMIETSSYSLAKRADGLQKIVRLFSLLNRKYQPEALQVFESFKKRWGMESLFRELDLPEKALQRKNTQELFDVFRTSIKNNLDEPKRNPSQAPPATGRAAPGVAAVNQPPKSLKERVEEVRTDPLFPRAVIDLIDKNKQNASGQSGAKYTELIETLLAIPWGKLLNITVSPAEFEEGLNRSHYGLEKPKEIICDFFANLIWRYRHFNESDIASWQRNGSVLLLVGPPGVGKTSLAISVATNLGIPYHKVSLGGMRDEADIRGYGFTYEGSKPGPIVQGLIKMGVMNGMFILDEADKTEKFAIATLLEILDPEQNHLFHDKYTQTSVDIDLSNTHFILTANSLETVPPAVLDRCDVIFLSRYSVEEKIAIAREHLIRRVRRKYMISEEEIFFDRMTENDLLRLLIKNYTSEAGVRDLERIIRTLFLRIHRKEILARDKPFVKITKERMKEYLDYPTHPQHINEDDRVGEMMGLGVNVEMGVGSLIPIQVTPVKAHSEMRDGWRGHLSIVHATGNLEKVMDESRKVATTAIFHCTEELEIDVNRMEEPVHIHFMGGSTKKDGPSAGGAIALALASFFLKRKIRRDVAMTGEVDTQGRIAGIGGLGVKLETAYSAGSKTLIIPRENLHGFGGIEHLPDALKKELQILTYKDWKGAHEPFDYTRHVLQVVAVDNIMQAADVAFIYQEELDALEAAFISHALMAREQPAETRLGPERHLRIINVDHPDELDQEFMRSASCEEGQGCILLVREEMREAILARIPGWEDQIEVRNFDPELESLSDLIRAIQEPLFSTSTAPLRISVIAPVSFLQQDGIRVEDFPSDPPFMGLRLFADCCTVENVQIKDCRNIVTRTYRHLARLNQDVLDESPFVVRSGSGVHMINLSFIPEKYRLDVQRSEEILYQCLLKWLSLMDEQREMWEETARDLKEVSEIGSNLRARL